MASISSLGIGSGLDLNGLLDQLRDAERSKLEPIEQQAVQQQAKISAFGQLQSALTKFQDSVAKVNDPALYESLSSNVAGDAFTATTDETAQPGSYSVEVTRLAQAGSLASNGTATRDETLFAADTTLTLDFGATYVDGEFDPNAAPARSLPPIDIAAGSTLEDVRDTINAQEDAGVSASIVFDGSEYRLALSSTETGAEASVVGMSFADGTLTQDDVTLRAGQDAAVNVNGIAITSPTNTVEGAIQGVNLTLAEVTPEGQPESLVVEQNTRAAREAVGGFVKAFNELKGTIGTLTSFDSETGEAGELNGDSTVRTIESRLRGALSGGVAEGELRTLNQVGISLQRDGTLELDNDKLDELVSGNMAALGEFFAGADEASGMGGQLDASLGQMLDDNGLVKNSISGAESQVERLTERYGSMEQSVERTIERYRTQFGQLDSMIAQMNQTSDYLTQQFNALDAQLGRD